MNLKSKKGFTLMELLIVIAIIGLIAAIAAPKMGSTVDDAKKAKFVGNLAALKTSIELFKATHAGMAKSSQTGDTYNIGTCAEAIVTNAETYFAVSAELDTTVPASQKQEWATPITDKMILANNVKKAGVEDAGIDSFADIIDTFQFTKVNGEKAAFAIAVDSNNKDYIIYTITSNTTPANITQNITDTDIVYSSKYNGYVEVKDANVDANRVYKTVDDMWNAYK